MVFLSFYSIETRWQREGPSLVSGRELGSLLHQAYSTSKCLTDGSLTLDERAVLLSTGQKTVGVSNLGSKLYTYL